MSKKQELIKSIRQMIGKPSALLFKDENGTYLDGKKLTASQERQIMRTHQVEVCTWIETEQTI